MMHYYYPDYGFGVFGFLGGVVHVLLWVFIVIFIIRIAKRHKHGGSWKMWSDHGALGVLRERYAKGEISKEEYEEKKKVLEG